MSSTLNSEEDIVATTKNWVAKVVIGLNLCPFAKPVFDAKAIRYQITEKEQLKQKVLSELIYLDSHEEIETTLLIVAEGLANFDQYLDALDLCNELLLEHKYEGIYQIASFHPEYVFEGSAAADPANYTNRSPYPMLHILREESLDKAISTHRNVDEIPARNVQLARKLGTEKILSLLRNN